jgi:hypothetical protein
MTDYRHPPVPSVGRTVHFSCGTSGGEFSSECRAAIVTEVTEHPDADGTVGLAVFNPIGLFLNRGVPHAEDKAPGTWHWPERID